MNEEDKQLLLKDLCGRLPYGVICEDMEGKTRPLFGITPTQHLIVTLDNATDGTSGLKFCTIDCVKPYLRPMSSITDKELIEFLGIRGKNLNSEELRTFREGETAIVSILPSYSRHIDWLNRNHFDYRGLIPKGLAIAVTKENNPYKE